MASNATTPPVTTAPAPTPTATPAPTNPPVVTPAPTTVPPTATPAATTATPAPTTVPPVTSAPITPGPTTAAPTLAPPTPAPTTPGSPPTAAPTTAPVTTTPAPITRPPTPTNGPVATPAPPGATPAPPSQTQSPGVPSPPGGSSQISNNLGSTGLSSGTIAGIAIGGVAAALVLLVILVVVCCCRRKKKKRYEDYERSPRQASVTAFNAKGNAPSFGQNGAFLPPQPPPGRQASPYQGQPPPAFAQGGPAQKLSPAQNKPPARPSPTTQPDSPHLISKVLPPPRPPSLEMERLGNSRAQYSYDELAQATNRFSKDNLVGEGGFGKVYQGVLKDGRLVAVKQLTAGGGQGEREFRAEVEIISRVHHRHLVNLVGYCITGDHRLLVYEFMLNNTLESHLHAKNKPPLDWPTRMKIALGAARGLAYLHEDAKPKIIHRDIKASNILLDENFEAQVSDFGLAKSTQDQASHVSTRVMGTFGYLAPEYAMTGKLTDKSDVYSFGVVLLELVTGRRPVDMAAPAGLESLVEWARPLLQQERLTELVDPRLEGQYDKEEVQRMLRAAMLCIRTTAIKRPRLGQVVRMLEGEGDLELARARTSSIGGPSFLQVAGGLEESEEFYGSEATSSQDFFGGNSTAGGRASWDRTSTDTSARLTDRRLEDSVDFSTPFRPPPPPPGMAPYNASPSRQGSFTPPTGQGTPGRASPSLGRTSSGASGREVRPVELPPPRASPGRGGGVSPTTSVGAGGGGYQAGQGGRSPGERSRQGLYDGRSVVIPEDLDEGR